MTDKPIAWASEPVARVNVLDGCTFTKWLTKLPDGLHDLFAAPAPSASSVQVALLEMVDNNIASLGNIATAAEEKSLDGLSKALRKTIDTLERCKVHLATRAAPSDAQDAARWRYAIKHWLDEHIATKQADEAIAASEPSDKS